MQHHCEGRNCSTDTPGQVRDKTAVDTQQSGNAWILRDCPHSNAPRGAEKVGQNECQDDSRDDGNDLDIRDVKIANCEATLTPRGGETAWFRLKRKSHQTYKGVGKPDCHYKHGEVAERRQWADRYSFDHGADDVSQSDSTNHRQNRIQPFVDEVDGGVGTGHSNLCLGEIGNVGGFHDDDDRHCEERVPTTGFQS